MHKQYQGVIDGVTQSTPLGNARTRGMGLPSMPATRCVGRNDSEGFGGRMSPVLKLHEVACLGLMHPMLRSRCVPARLAGGSARPGGRQVGSRASPGHQAPLLSFPHTSVPSPLARDAALSSRTTLATWLQSTQSCLLVIMLS